MINNYLDWVKGQRLSAIERMIGHKVRSRFDSTRWGQGFYAGHAQAASFEAHHWRKLQKDMETWLSDKDNAILPLANIILGQKFARYTGG